MRITNNISTRNFLLSINQNIERQNEIQGQLTDGKQLHRPSDDPIGMIRALRFRNQLSENEQYTKNTSDAQSWIDQTDSALSDVNTILKRARTLATQGATDIIPQQSRDAIAAEIDQLIGQLVQVSNSKIGEKYIFAGTSTGTAPYSLVSTGVTTPNATVSVGVYKGNAGTMPFELAPGMKDHFNVTGSELFGPAGDVFNHLIGLTSELRQGNTAAVMGYVDTLERDNNSILNIQAEIGAKANKLELADARLSRDMITITGDLSKTEDVDVAKAILTMKNEENVYRSALSVGAKILPPTLVDFLR